MQTFLPYPDFAASAAVLDQARLGKQRVETLQILRALVLPDYGWRNHPATRMWMGYVPALTVYGLAMVSEWVSRGHADSTAPLISEFAPDSAAAFQAGTGP
ncbi:MSMEG_6728 family protein, partial [Arthrobacter sp. 35/47]|uniref:MSMEG_6728 family protein n=1 Tax=Arthrobacter sp. 35/47 TaxID=269454 RepID=UPI0020A6405B